MPFKARLLPLIVGALVLVTSPALAISLPKLGLPSLKSGKSPSPNVWAQEKSDLKPDPAVRFGRLPNGMRYAVLNNATPKGPTSVRLYFDVGSVMEGEQERGLAHFLEHMAFNGSARVPEGEMVKILQRHGLSFGADTNASTSFNETVYQLDLPTSDDETIDTALMLMRETASELTIAPDAVNRERGVVLSEERSRDTPGLRIYKESLGLFLKGQIAAERLPIGKVGVLQTAGAEVIRGFYRRYYRPERAVLVMVGDFDPAAIEASIKTRFSDWKGVGEPGVEPDLGKPLKRGAEARVAVDPGAPLTIQIASARPVDPAPDAIERRRRDFVRDLALAVLNRRLGRLGRNENPPFIGAYAYDQERNRSVDLTVLTITADPGDWRRAMETAVREQQRLEMFGVSADELEREITEARAAMRAVAAQAGTRRTSELADDLVESVSDRSVFMNPVDELVQFEAMSKGLTAAEVSARAKTVFAGEGPLIFVSSPTEIAGGEPAILAAHAAARAAPVEAGPAQVARTWPYESFGPAGTPVETREVADLDIVQVRFANGVALTVKPTRFRDDQILVRVRIGDGQLDLPGDRVSTAWAAPGALTEGGLKDLSADEVEQILSSRVYSAQFNIGEDAFQFQGRTQPEDFTVQMQLLAAYAKEPGLRPEAFQRMRAYASTLHDQMEATPSGVLGRELSSLMHSGDARFAFPSRAQIAAARPEDFRALLQPQLESGEIEITVVGDIEVDKAIEVVGASFGALPQRKASAVPPLSRAVKLPSPRAEPVRLTHKGRADQGAAYIMWPTDDFFSDPHRARALRVLAQVLENRLVEELRETDGDTYSPNANAAASLTWDRYGYLAASVEMAPERLPNFFAAVERTVADLRLKPATDDELQRARKPMIENLDKVRQTNEYWLEQLSGAQGDPRRLDALRTIEASLARVGVEDLRRLADAYLKPDRAWRLVVTPEG